MARIPIRSLQGNTDDATDALQLSMYLDEIRRQARIATTAFGRAWMKAMVPGHDPDDVWADLQSMLFASIIVQRILDPTLNAVRKHGGRDAATCRAFADTRAKKLRDLLEIDDNNISAFKIADVRHPFEHFDERMDQTVLDNATSVVDWYIADDQHKMRSVRDEGSGGTLRTFVAPAGLLFFDDASVDLFMIDFALSTLWFEAVPDAEATLSQRIRGTGGNLFGGQQFVALDTSTWQRRLDAFIDQRNKIGQPVTPGGQKLTQVTQKDDSNRP